MKPKLLLLFFALSMFACSKEESAKILTNIEKIARAWRISSVTLNGQPVDIAAFANFRFTLNNTGSYTIISGNAPALPTLNISNNGTFTLSSNDTQLVLDKGTANEYNVSIVETPTETKFVIRFKIPKNINKLEPEYTFTLVNN